jgi:hypothetical protein
MRVRDETVETPGETGAWSRDGREAALTRLLTDRAGEPARWAASDSQPSLS